MLQFGKKVAIELTIHTITLSLCMMVFKRCAMVSTVESVNLREIVCCMSSSVLQNQLKRIVLHNLQALLMYLLNMLVLRREPKRKIVILCDLIIYYTVKTLFKESKDGVSHFLDILYNNTFFEIILFYLSQK